MNPLSAIITLIAITTCVSVRASSWDFKETTALADWTTLGRVQQSEDGIVIGPSDGPDAISGIKSSEPADPSSRFTVKLGIDALAVAVPAPDNAENENDIRINIVLNPTSSPSWESADAVIAVVLFFNSRNSSLYAGIYGKGEGLPNQGAEPITDGAFLGEGTGSGNIDIEIAVDERDISVQFLRNGQVLKTLEAPLSENLRGLLTTPLYTVIYQQNIREGSGSFILQNVSRE